MPKWETVKCGNTLRGMQGFFFFDTEENTANQYAGMNDAGGGRKEMILRKATLAGVGSLGGFER